MSLNTNMELQGKRHEYLCEYEAGVNSDGKFQAVQFTLYSNGGATYDGTFGAMNMAMTTTDNAYYFPNFSTKGVCCRTNLPTNTYMRAPGCAPAIFFVEHVMERASQLLGMDPDTVRQTNFYQQGQVTPYGTPIISTSSPTPPPLCVASGTAPHPLQIGPFQHCGVSWSRALTTKRERAR